MADQPSLIDLASPLWSAHHLREALGLDEAATKAEERDGRLLALRASDGPEPFYPVCQFETVDGRVRVKPALIQFMRAAQPINPWTVLVALKTPAPELDGLSPLQWVDQGRPSNAIVAVAESVRRDLEHV